ncbi:MAG: hypothetical protein MRY83_22330 [Flavobacteriales bacterium]|nr:hypothetical protein [Flavobacteriales bacterium]
MFHQIFNEPYDNTKLHLTLSRYYKTIENFLSHETLMADEVLSNLLTLESLKTFDSEKHFSGKKKAIQKNLQNRDIPSNVRLYGKLTLEEKSFEYFSRLQKPESVQDLQELYDSIDEHFLYLKLKYACELLSRKQILDQTFDLSFLDAILDYGAQNFSQESKPLIYGFYRLVELVMHNRDTDFKFLKTFVQSKAFNTSDKRVIYGFLINFCIRMSNLGNVIYLEELFSIYVQLIDEGLLVQNNKLYLYDYKNVATTAIRLKKFDWVKAFTENYTNYIPHKDRPSALAYNLARIDFYQEKYKSAIRVLSGVDYSDLYYELGSRSLIIKIYFELDDYSLFEANCNSFKIFLKRLKIGSEYQRKIYNNFIKHSIRLFKIKEGNTKSKSQWIEEIQKTQEIADRTWVLEKMETLKEP